MSLNHGISKYKAAAKTKTSTTKSNVKADPKLEPKLAKAPVKGSAAARSLKKSGKASPTSAAEFDEQEAAIDQSIETLAVATESLETEIELKALSESALQEHEIKEKNDEDKELEAEIEKELVADTVVTSGLVRDDFTPVNSTRDKLIIEYAPLIKYISQKIAARLPANIELDDLMSSGVIGLMDAIDKYDSSRDNKFKTYAEFRIRGAILDELRAQDWVPRSVREKAKQLERVYSKLEQKNGRQATDDEVCAEMGLSQEEFHDMLNQVRSVSLLSYDDLSSFSKTDKRALHGYGESGSKAPTPYSEVSVASIKRMIAEAIGDLPEKQRLVLSLYYYEDLNLKEIGRVLDVTESRVSQLHTQAIIRLKSKLKTHWDDFLTLMS